MRSSPRPAPLINAPKNRMDAVSPDRSTKRETSPLASTTLIAYSMMT